MAVPIQMISTLVSSVQVTWGATVLRGGAPHSTALVRAILSVVFSGLYLITMLRYPLRSLWAWFCCEYDSPPPPRWLLVRLEVLPAVGWSCHIDGLSLGLAAVATGAQLLLGTDYLGGNGDGAYSELQLYNVASFWLLCLLLVLQAGPLLLMLVRSEERR